MPERRSLSSRLHARLSRWESALALVFLVEFVEDRFVFRNADLAAWAKVGLKMALVVGVLGGLLQFANRRLDTGLAATRGAGESLVVPRLAMHALLLAAAFVGFFWLKLGKLPWV